MESVTKRKKLKPKIRERDIQKSILDWLSLRRIFHWRASVGAMKIRGHFYHFGQAGQPDIMAVLKSTGQFCGIEVKAGGKEQSRKQREFQAEVERAGGLYIVAHSLEDVTSRI